MAPENSREHPPNDEQHRISNVLDDALVSRTDHRTVVDHIFFQASRSVSHEQSQAIARIVITFLIAILLFSNAFMHSFTPVTQLNIAIVVSYFSFSLFHYFWVKRSQERFLWRRYLVISGDLLCTSYLTYRFGLVGLGFFPLYLWIMIGNGLRFGPHYLRVATAVGIAGFLGANWIDGVLQDYPGLVIGLLVGLVLMPKFFLVMIRRLAEANVALKDQKEEAEHLARHDALTGLPNRFLLEGRITQALAVAERTGNRIAVLFFDLDGFKTINDTYGHNLGDRLLKQIAQCLQSRVRRSDTVARLGGDEFIILMEQIKDSDEIAAIVEQLFQCSGHDYELDEHRVYTTWSCGIAVYPKDGADSQTLIKNADTAMYRAKAAGTNQFRLYDATMSEEVEAQLRRRDELRKAVEQQQFEVLFQPQLRGAERRLVGVEALLRWRHPRHGLLMPGDFLPLAERSGLAGPLARLVLETALPQVRRWREDGLDELTLHVNISPRQLNDAQFPIDLMQLLQTHRFPATALGLELDESSLIEETETADRLFETLRRQGVRVVLDNFGTGYSSLNYLKRFHIDRIKIDRSFIAGIPTAPRDCKLIEAILDLARHLDMEVLADGVETDAQFDWLHRHRCELFQGDLLSPPLSVHEFENYLRRTVDTPVPLS